MSLCRRASRLLCGICRREGRFTRPGFRGVWPSPPSSATDTASCRAQKPPQPNRFPSWLDHVMYNYSGDFNATPENRPVPPAGLNPVRRSSSPAADRSATLSWLPPRHPATNLSSVSTSTSTQNPRRSSQRDEDACKFAYALSSYLTISGKADRLRTDATNDGVGLAMDNADESFSK